MSREFIVPAKIYTGEGSLELAEKELCTMGDRVLIVTDPVVIKLNCFEKLTAMLSKNRVSYTIYSDVAGEPTDTIVNAGLAKYDVEDCDCMIAVGGGSPIDTMKAIAALSVNGGRISDYMGKVIKGKMPPMAAIPTTAGTGSEATKSTALSRRLRSSTLRFLCPRPKALPLQQGLTRSLTRWNLIHHGSPSPLPMPLQYPRSSAL